MSNIKAVTILGARPQFIKAAMVSRAALAGPALGEKIIHTSQHLDAICRIYFLKNLIYRSHIAYPEY